jgi:hypothetical protein
MVLPSFSALFQGWPAFLFPAPYRLLVTLVCPAIRFLQALSEGFEQAAYMRRVVSDPKFPLYHLSHPLARPYISSKTARWRSLGQKLGHFGALLLTQARWRSGSRLAL